MRTTKRIIGLGTIGLGTAVLGLALAVPAFAQEPRPCIHFQTGCSDAPYPVTESAPKHVVRQAYHRRAHRPLYDVRAHQEAAFVQPAGCVRFQTGCSDAPYPVTHP